MPIGRVRLCNERLAPDSKALLMTSDSLNGKEPFGRSALLDERAAPCDAATVRELLTMLASRAQWQLDKQLLDHLSPNHRNYELEGLRNCLDVACGQYEVKLPQQLAARRFLVSNQLFEFSPSPFDPSIARPEQLRLLMLHGADALKKASEAHWRALARGLNWVGREVLRKKAAGIAIVDCPRGGSVPARALARWLNRRGIAARTHVLLTSRKDTGAAAIKHAVRKMAASIPDDHAVVYVDDAIT